MIPVLKEIDALDIDLETYDPRLDEWFIQLTLSIGSADSPGADLFLLSVCSAAALAERAELDRYAWGVGTLILPKWNLAQVRALVERTCLECERPTWGESARALGRYFMWEFA